MRRGSGRATASSKVAVISQRARVFWQERSLSERRALSVALAVVALTLLWWLALGPALATLRSAEAQHRVLDAQLQVMQNLAVQAATLKALPTIKAEESRRALDLAVRQLGTAAQLSLQGERAVVTVKNVEASALSAWLSQARTNARAVPQEAHLRINATRSGWDGSVVLRLPAP